MSSDGFIRHLLHAPVQRYVLRLMLVKRGFSLTLWITVPCRAANLESLTHAFEQDGRIESFGDESSPFLADHVAPGRIG